MKRGIIFIQLLLIFSSEMAVMELFHPLLSKQGPFVAAIYDAALLIFFYSPALWLLCFHSTKDASAPPGGTDFWQSRSTLFIKLAVTVFLAELLVEFLLPSLFAVPAGRGGSLLDALLIVILILPVFSWQLSKNPHLRKVTSADFLGTPMMVYILLLYLVFHADMLEELLRPYMSSDGFGQYYILIDSLLTTLFIAPFFWLLLGRPLTRAAQFEKSRTRVILDQLADAVIILDVDGRINTMNPAALKAFGFPAAELYGQTADNLFKGDQLQINALIAGLNDQPKHKKKILLRDIACRNHIETELVMDLSLAISEEYGQKSWILILHDVTPYKQAERALSASDKRFRQIFEQSDDAIVFCKPETCSIIDINTTFSDLFGYTKEEVLCLGLTSLISDEETDKLLAAVIGSNKGRQSKLDNITGVRRNGSSFNLSMHCKQMIIDGINITFCTFRDITRRIYLENQAKDIQSRLIQTNKMTSLGLMVSGVAHEINNPNNFILSNSRLLADSWEDARKILRAYYQEQGEFYLGGIPFSELDEHTPQLFNGITEGAGRINEIVNTLKNFYRPDQPSEVLIDLNTVARSATSLLRHELVNFTKNFNQQLAPELPMIKGNAQQLSQVIINLLMNAGQSLPDKNCSISLETGLSEAGDEVILRVRDQGMGMSAQDGQRIMEPFFTTKLDTGGTGLGLSICRSIIVEHDGTFEFDSQPSQGTCFTVRLPVALQDPKD